MRRPPLSTRVVAAILVTTSFEPSFGLGARNGGRLRSSAGLITSVMWCRVTVLTLVRVSVTRLVVKVIGLVRKPLFDMTWLPFSISGPLAMVPVLTRRAWVVNFSMLSVVFVIRGR